MHKTTFRGTFGLVLLAFGQVLLAAVPLASTSTTLSGGDRSLNFATFSGSSTVFGPASLTRFVDGKLTNNSGTYAWSAAIPRDMALGQDNYSGNPDRADNASPYALESASQGTIAEIFSSGNLSWIIDGEDNGSWTLDLLLPSGQYFVDDHDPSTVEFAFLERGMNSDLGVRAIWTDGVNNYVSSGIVLLRTQQGAAGFTLDTLEINGAQQVGGWGIDISDLGSVGGPIIGLQIYALPQFNGPDLVAVMAAEPVPEPATLVGLAGALGLLVARRRARR